MSAGQLRDNNLITFLCATLFSFWQLRCMLSTCRNQPTSQRASPAQAARHSEHVYYQMPVISNPLPPVPLSQLAAERDTDLGPFSSRYLSQMLCGLHVYTDTRATSDKTADEQRTGSEEQGKRKVVAALSENN